MNPRVSRRSVLVGSAATALGLPSLAFAQDDYPNRLIRIVLPVAPGAGTDTLARLIAEPLRAKTGRPVIVENRAGGASGNVGAEHVFRSPPDGYTFMFSAAGPIGINKLVMAKMPFDPAEFTHVSLAALIPNVLLVKADSPYKSVRDLIAAAKANPGKLNYGSGGAGTTTHITAELLKSLTGTDIIHVPYKASAAAVTAQIQGQTDFQFAELSSTFPHIKGGTLRALAVGSEARAPLLPDVPTMSETLPGFVSTVWYGFVAPPKTPPAIVNKMAGWLGEIMKQPDMVARLQAINVVPIGSTPAEMGRFVQAEIERWGSVVRAAKITSE